MSVVEIGKLRSEKEKQLAYGHQQSWDWNMHPSQARALFLLPPCLSPWRSLRTETLSVASWTFPFREREQWPQGALSWEHCEPMWTSCRESTDVAMSAVRTGTRLFTLGFLSLSGYSSCSLSPVLSSIIVSRTWRWQKQSNLELSLLPENEIKTNGPVIHKICHL